MAEGSVAFEFGDSLADEAGMVPQVKIAYLTINGQRYLPPAMTERMKWS